MVDLYLVDTNVISEPRKVRPEPRVRNFFAASAKDQLFLSVVSLAEIRYGIQADRDAVRSNDMSIWLANDVRPAFAGRVLPITESIMLRWRLLLDDGKARGRVFTQPDLLIAATALEHNLILVTRNVRDFLGTGVPILNPWDDEP